MYAIMIGLIKKLPGLLGRIRIGGRTRLRGSWEEGGGVYGVQRRCGGKEDEVTILQKGTTTWQSINEKYGLI